MTIEGQTFRIRTMRVEDVPAVTRLDAASFTMPWPAGSYQYEVTRNHNSVPLVATTGDTSVEEFVIGMIVVWIVLDEGQIGTIAVDSAWRRRHVGSALLAEGISAAAKRGVRSFFLEVRQSNLSAQDLYRKFGFFPIDTRKRYYQDNGEDGIVMLLKDPDMNSLDQYRVS
jgi:ribosomal-protein-alanine N-acetyltransferase